MNNIKKTSIIGLVLVSLILAGFSGCAKETKRFEAEFLTLFDTATKIVGYTDSKSDFEKQSDFLYSEIGEYHKLFDIYNDYEGINNIKTINDQAGISPVQVDRKLIELLIFSKEIHELTDGNVNVAFGSVLKLWHQYRETGMDDPDNARIPPMEKLVEASKHTDINKMIIDEQAGTVYLEDKEMSLDVGAVAKGYAAEMACREMERTLGVESLLISLGGNVRAIGFKDSEGNPWRVGVQNPDVEDGTSLIETVSLVDASLVTSGDYQRYYFVDGKRYHHIIDPKTLMPADHYRAVTVLTKDSGVGDGLSTAVFILPLEQAKALLQKVPETEAVFVMPDGSLEYTSGFKNYIR